MNRAGIILACGVGTLLAGCGQSGDSAILANPTTEISELNQKEFGDIVVNFNAINSDQIPADVASTYNISRSKGRALLNISVHEKQPDGTTTAVHSSVTASAKNLTGQLKTMEMREIVEGTAIYYIGEIAVANAETLIFDIVATTDGEPDPMNIRYQNQFYTD